MQYNNLFVPILIFCSIFFEMFELFQLIQLFKAKTVNPTTRRLRNAALDHFLRELHILGSSDIKKLSRA